MSQIMRLNDSCPYTCHYSFDRSLNATAKARIFHIRNLDYRDLPAQNPDAFNVYFTLESPVHSFYFNPYDGSKFKDYFNLTITYRSNADVYFPYDAFVELDGSEEANDLWTDKEVSVFARINVKMIRIVTITFDV